MTREEARKVFLSRGYIEVEGGTIYDPDKWREACVIISEWLEQQPCEDCVSKQTLLDIITEQERLASDRVRDTPSSFGNGLYTWINPAYTRYSAQLSERSQFKTMIQTMPPVTPQPKTGHWIERRNKATGHIESVCSECGAEEGYPYNDYCGNCGAKMIEEQESEDKE